MEKLESISIFNEDGGLVSNIEIPPGGMVIVDIGNEATVEVKNSTDPGLGVIVDLFGNDGDCQDTMIYWYEDEEGDL